MASPPRSSRRDQTGRIGGAPSRTLAPAGGSIRSSSARRAAASRLPPRPAGKGTSPARERLEAAWCRTSCAHGWGVVETDEVELRAWHTDHYEKREGGWAVVWSQATETTG
jgi:hypothetical protein